MQYPRQHCDQDWYRLIPSRFPPVDVYERLGVPALRTAAPLIEAQTNPRLLSKERAMQSGETNRAASARLQNWNHAPFTYKNPEGTYLLDPNYGVMEVVETERSALAFYLRRREIFLDRTSEPAMGLDMRLLKTRIIGDFDDLTSLSPDLSQKERWSIGCQLYDSGSLGAVFQRPDFPRARFLAIFDGSTLQPTIQATHYRFVWDGSVIKTVYNFSTGEEVARADLLADASAQAAA